jgi:hypothetical protein
MEPKQHSLGGRSANNCFGVEFTLNFLSKTGFELDLGSLPEHINAPKMDQVNSRRPGCNLFYTFGKEKVKSLHLQNRRFSPPSDDFQICPRQKVNREHGHFSMKTAYLREPIK